MALTWGSHQGLGLQLGNGGLSQASGSVENGSGDANEAVPDSLSAWVSGCKIGQEGGRLALVVVTEMHDACKMAKRQVVRGR